MHFAFSDSLQTLLPFTLCRVVHYGSRSDCFLPAGLSFKVHLNLHIGLSCGALPCFLLQKQQK